MQHIIFFMKIPMKENANEYHQIILMEKKLLQSKDLNINNIKNWKSLMASVKHN